MPKNLNSNLYLIEDIVWDRKEKRLYYKTNPNGYLFACHKSGHYQTKIKADDLPDWYVHGRYYKRFGYISAKDIKQLELRVFHFTNHLYRDDTLYISYQEEPQISKQESKYGGIDYFNYDYLVYGTELWWFLEKAALYSDVDFEPIIDGLIEKAKWFEENHEEWMDVDMHKQWKYINKHIDLIRNNRKIRKGDANEISSNG